MTQFYAYAHLRPDFTPFYVGKGTLTRARMLTPSVRNEWHGNIVAKYGRKNIIIETMPCASEAEAFLREQLAISALRASGVELVNQKDGGEGGRNPSAEVRMKMSLARKGKPSTRLDYRVSEETRAKISASLLGRKQSAETIAKRAATHTGMKRPPGTGEKISAANRGRKHSAEHSAKIAASRRGKPLSFEHRAKLSVAGRIAWATKRR
jgi:hypothetical protein